MTWLARSRQSGRRQTVTGFGLILIVAALLLLTGSRCGSAQIRIAVAVTLSGPAANTGTETLAGIRLALEQAGPAARDVELAVIDDRGSVERAREEAGRIAGFGVNALVEMRGVFRYTAEMLHQVGIVIAGSALHQHIFIIPVNIVQFKLPE